MNGSVSDLGTSAGVVDPPDLEACRRLSYGVDFWPLANANVRALGMTYLFWEIGQPSFGD